MSVTIKHRNDAQFNELVSEIVDSIHYNGLTYAWVNKKAAEALKHQGIDGIPDADSVEYQQFVNLQTHYLRDIVIAVLNEF
jgi:hypothetical protein